VRLVPAIVIVAACGAHAPAPARPHLPVPAGTYHFERTRRDPQSMSSNALVLTLARDGAATATMTHTFFFDAQAAGELARDDEIADELAGTWRDRGDGIAVALAPVRSCARGFGEPPCAYPSRYPEGTWHLQCVRELLVGSPALVCTRRGAALAPKYTTTVDGAPRLVLRGPD
jgi:hypothetical protein